MYDRHIETIKCPECGKVQTAKVKHTVPFWDYTHQCGNSNCLHWITESEWQRVGE